MSLRVRSSQVRYAWDRLKLVVQVRVFEMIRYMAIDGI